MSPLLLAVVQRRMMEAEAILDRTNSAEVRMNCARIIRQCRIDLGMSVSPYDFIHNEPRATLPDFPVTVDTRTARERSDERTTAIAETGSVVVVVLCLMSLAMLGGLL